MKIRKTLRIAWWELGKNAGLLDRRTLAIVGVSLLLVGLLTPVVADRGMTVDSNIYRVGVSEDSVYYPAVEQDATLAPAEPTRTAMERGDVDVRIVGNRAIPADSPKGQAALGELRTAVSDYNDRLMSAERNQSAAFPIVVSLTYVERESDTAASVGGSSSGANDGTADNGEPESSDGARETTGGSTTGDSDDGSTDDESGGFGAPALGGSAFQPGDGSSGRPSNISPPFPFQSLVLAFAFVLPMNFVIQGYASSVIGERINRRGELLLVSPVSRADIIAGKTLPYLAIMLAIASVTALVIGGGLVAVAAVFPIALVFLASGFVGAMFARSFKELTFVMVAISVALTSYVFIPAVFTDVHPIALISPLTLVVSDLQGNAVSVGEYVFSTAPFYLSAAVLFALGAGVYREEDMFTQLPLHQKVIDAIASRLRGRRSVATLSALFIPFVFVAELFAVSLLFIFPASLALPVLFVVIAVVEEAAKSVHIYAGFARSTFDRSAKTALVLGGLSGLGFFVGEKVTLLTQLVGLPELTVGRAAFGAGAASASTPFVALGLLLAPLALHAVTAAVSAVGASKDESWYAGAFTLAVLIHAGYNFTVVTTLG